MCAEQKSRKNEKGGKKMNKKEKKKSPKQPEYERPEYGKFPDFIHKQTIKLFKKMRKEAKK